MSPVQSKAQMRAMAAAAHGASTLGIPASVGKEFMAATPKGAKLPERAPAKRKKKPSRHGRDVAELSAEMKRRGMPMMGDSD